MSLYWYPLVAPHELREHRVCWPTCAETRNHYHHGGGYGIIVPFSGRPDLGVVALDYTDGTRVTYYNRDELA